MYRHNTIQRKHIEELLNNTIGLPIHVDSIFIISGKHDYIAESATCLIMIGACNDYI